ncbi:hypothetical protein [Frigoribacterium sp. RIT-PI-h]|uniref:hypothetical protein n=1 Tax=Frigoribacterium sp. RIT-PI-h TaxID=1690245 RepID=UPI0006B9014C|nr:hypothetical protein [Frigoribacterium sp. RIT-PI-h]KPG80307.1 hypothetical protein AEQ27_11725 [Frigoribacterium sp. RIT-PI-h]
MELLIPYFISALVTLAIAYFVIRAAVLSALISHYKTIRLYERTGEWQPGPHNNQEPKKLP